MNNRVIPHWFMGGLLAALAFVGGSYNLFDSPIWAYSVLLITSFFVFYTSRTAQLLSAPIQLYVWFTLFNFVATYFLNIGGIEGTSYFRVRLYSIPDYFSYLSVEQLYMAAATLITQPFITDGVSRDKRFSASGSYRKMLRYWPAIYIVGTIAVVILLVAGDGLGAAARKQRVAGLGVFVIFQYYILIAFAMYLLSKKTDKVAKDFFYAVIFSVPLIYTHERSFFISMCLVVVTYHVYFTRRLNLRQVVIAGGIGMVMIVALGLWRSFLARGAIELQFFEVFQRDTSMHLGYLLYRDVVSYNLSPELHLETLVLSFSFMSGILQFLIGAMPENPHNVFTSEIFPLVQGTTTFSMGFPGEAYYIFGNFRFACYLGASMLLCVFARRSFALDPILFLVVSSLVFRVAKAGAVTAITPIIIVVILVFFLKLISKLLPTINSG